MNTTLVLRLLAVGAACSTSAMAWSGNAQLVADVVYDFEGYRAMVPVISEDLALSLDPGSPDSDAVLSRLAAQEHEKKLFVSALDGVLWGNGRDEYAAQWYNRLSEWNDASWSHFRRGMSPFPDSTQMMGRSESFAWRGVGWHGIHVHDLDDTSDVTFWARLRIVDRLAGFTFNPNSTFDELGIRGQAGEITRQHKVQADGSLAVIDRFVPEHAPQLESLHFIIYQHPFDSAPDRWGFVQSNHRANVSLLYVIRPRPQTREARLLPRSIDDLRAAHHDVERIERLIIQDHRHEIMPASSNTAETAAALTRDSQKQGSQLFIALGWLAASSMILLFVLFEQRKQRKEIPHES